MVKSSRLIGIIGVLCLCTGRMVLADEALPAFPGAEGAGAYTPGGRGGQIHLVTTLQDYIPGQDPIIPGSFRAAVEAQGARIVIFRVSGYIDLKTNLTVRNPYITIAGQTAPGDGICLRNYEFAMAKTHDVIVRHLRCRTGDRTSKASELDAINMWEVENVIVDHCSATWSTDECLSVTGGSDKVTVQWCIIAEGLTTHSYGSLIQSYDGNITFHHNLYASSRSRNPRPGGYQYQAEHMNDPGPTVDFRNNVIYNWGGLAGYTGSDVADETERMTINYVGNYLKPGPSSPDTTSPHRRHAFTIYKGATAQIHVADNHMEGFPSGNADNWQLIHEAGGVAVELPHPVAATPVMTESATMAYESVLAQVGATLPARDAVDRRLVDSVRKGTGQIPLTAAEAGGWPELVTGDAPEDADRDGMPDAWESSHGLNPESPADAAGDRDGDSYTDIEEFLNDTDPNKREEAE